MRKTLKVVAFGGGPADAFIKAAGITDSTQQTAIKTLVNDLNGYGLWTKMKAIYPMVGGNATAHSYNLKDTTKFQITWNGGLTHSSTGTIGNGTNGYGNTNLIPLNDLLDNSCHLSFYSRTNESAGNIWDCGVADDARSYLTMLIKNSSTQFRPLAQDFSQSIISNSDSKGFYITNRTASNISNGWKNGTKIISPNANSLTRANLKIFLLSLNYSGTGGAVFYSTKECAFATIGDGLSDTEAANLYTSIQKFQTTLNRFVGTPIYPSFDSDAQSFMTSASITDSTQQAAVNYLVTDLKSNNLWTKMKAVYPMVGGTASTHKFNLKDPRDLDAAYRLSFNGGWTHSSTGATPNGTNAYADSFLNAANTLNKNNAHVSFYSRTDSNGVFFDIGASNFNSSQLVSIYSREGGQAKADIGSYSTSRVSVTVPNSLGFLTSNRTASNVFKLFKNGTQIGSNSYNDTTLLPSSNFLISAVYSTIYEQYSNHQCAFATIGDGLSDTDASNLYTIIQNYQTILSRQV